MATAIISLITLVLSIAWAIIRWKNSLKHKKEVLKSRIKEWEVKLGEALAKNDSAGISVANAMLKQLRKDYALLPDK